MVCDASVVWCQQKLIIIGKNRIMCYLCRTFNTVQQNRSPERQDSDIDSDHINVTLLNISKIYIYIYMYN